MFDLTRSHTATVIDPVPSIWPQAETIEDIPDPIVPSYRENECRVCAGLPHGGSRSQTGCNLPSWRCPFLSVSASYCSRRPIHRMYESFQESTRLQKLPRRGLQQHRDTIFAI